MTLPIYVDALAHYGVGVGLSLLDRRLSIKSKKNVEARIQRKLEQADALNYLVSNQEAQTSEYARKVELARDYLRETGVSVKPVQEKGLKGLVDKFGDWIAHYRTNERLNGNSAVKNLAIAYSLELAADGAVFATGAGSGLQALACTSYQGLCLFAGIQTGAAIVYLKDKFRTAKEKEIDATAKQLVSDGKILKIVSGYSLKPVVETQAADNKEEVSEKKPIDYAAVGARAGEVVADVAQKAGTAIGSGLQALRDKMNAKKIAEQQAADAAEKARKEAEDKRREEIRKGLQRY